MQQLGRLLLAGYALAAIGGVAVHQAGLGLLPAMVTFWLGGAVIVAMLAVLVTPFLAVRPVATSADDAALAVALRAWEEDRLAEQTTAVRSEQRNGTGAAG